MEYNYEDALTNLFSHTHRERFASVKFFIKNKYPEIKPKLIEQLQVERVMYIKKALERALNILDNNQIMNLEESEIDVVLDDPENVKKYFKAKAIDEFSGIVLHELEPKIGMLKTYLETEINDYENSSSKKAIEEFEQFFMALESLRESSSPPKYKEVDVSKLIKKIVSEEIKLDLEIIYEGSENCIVRTDKHLLSFAISNGIRNAQESLSEISNEKKRKIMISWDITDIDCWICIADEGTGLTGSPEQAFILGNSSKDGHSGFGLGIIHQSMESIGGTAELLDNGVGAKLILRWNEIE